MTWNPDDPFPAPAALGETDCGARNLPHFLCSLLVPGPVLVLGSSDLVLEAAKRHEVTVVDWNRRRLTRLSECLRERGLEARLLCRDPERQDLAIVGRSMWNVVCLDVLEHFRSDVTVLERLHRVLAPEGRLVARVRAHPVGREELRYDPEQLRTSLKEAGFRPLNLRYWNFLGVPSALMARKWGDRSSGGATGEDPSPGDRPWWDVVLDLWFRTVENRVGFPTGVSLVAVAAPHLEKVPVRRQAGVKGLRRHGTREAYEPTALTR
jgi:SAM-dependent methyltransferase